MTRHLLLVPGYWCECRADGRLIGSFDAYSPHQALRWVRISLMMIAHGLDNAPYHQARTWTEQGQDQALHALTVGQPQTLALTHRATALTWTTRPVTYLPLTHRQTTELPACAHRFPDPSHSSHPH
ncbi:hypothetical protein [Streptomyces sp. JJ36]|uniref:hypothetical protein n=1 Tax=Streptomyces sp. JJ36 TaxID=2736645 RepID=UPI001F2351C6|nr:hypothetical protein [Streptomyces sp. JJ36]MCF6525584.1 hypothetical protein [Streptomyces sp. JJ36]